MGFHNITEANGVGIAATGMTIVFAALTFISVFILLLPAVLRAFSTVLPPEPHAEPPSARRPGGRRRSPRRSASYCTMLR